MKVEIEDLDNGKFLNEQRVYTDRLRVEGGWLYRTYSTVAIHTVFVPDFDGITTK